MHSVVNLLKGNCSRDQESLSVAVMFMDNIDWMSLNNINTLNNDFSATSGAEVGVWCQYACHAVLFYALNNAVSGLAGIQKSDYWMLIVVTLQYCTKEQRFGEVICPWVFCYKLG